MEEKDVLQRIDTLEQKIDAVYSSAEKTRKYFLAVLVISVIAFVVPLLGLIFAIPSFLSVSSQMEGL